MLVVALNDSVGRPRVDTEVLILAILPDGAPNLRERLLLRDAVDSSQAWSGYGVRLSTDAAGVVRARVKLGYVAGDIAMLVVAPSPGAPVADTVHFLVNPGAPDSIDLQPRDSALYEGRSYSLRPRVFDAYGNERNDKVTTATDSTAITVTADGLVEAKRIGRALVHATLADVVGSAWVSVVPHGVLVASRAGLVGQPDQLVQFELDGSHLSVLDARSVHEPSYSPSGRRMVLVDRSEGGYGNGGRIFVRESDGTEHPLTADYVDYQEAQQSPRFSADEEWIYYAGGMGHSSIIRVHPDGTGSEVLVGPIGDEYITYGGNYEPVPSPDGRHVAYLPMYYCCRLTGLRILDLSSGDTVVGPYANHLRWIPGTDSLVASTSDGFEVSEGFAVLRLDGTVARSVAARMYGESPFDISPDGRWIAVSTSDGNSRTRLIHLVNLDSGMRLPLGYSTYMGSLAWQP
jgi:hypothetical protein